MAPTEFPNYRNNIWSVTHYLGNWNPRVPYRILKLQLYFNKPQNPILVFFYDPPKVSYRIPKLQL